MMDEKELAKVWTALDTRITTLNDRTKAHTLQIKELRKDIQMLKKLREDLLNGTLSCLQKV